MIFSKSIEMMINHFGDKSYIFGDRPEAAYDGDFNAYVHVPFCMSTCEHCFFYKELYRHVKKCGFQRAILTEIEKVPFSGRIHCLKIGGGTPNLLSVEELQQIIEAIRLKAEVGQIHIQLLASLLTEQYIKALKEIGVQSLEIGYESFSKEVSSSIGRRTESVAQFLSLVHYCREEAINVCVNVLAGMPNQRETSFIEDLYLIAEMAPQAVNVKPLIRRGEAPEIRHFELVELAADVLLEKGYMRTGLWHFEMPVRKETTETTEQNAERADRKPIELDSALPLLGFGPSAYSQAAGYHSMNPDMDLYIYEQLYGHSRVLYTPVLQEDLNWRRLFNKISRLQMNPDETLPAKMNWYLRWMQLSGAIKNGRPSEKGLLNAHAYNATFRSVMPNPLSQPELIENAMVYEAEKAFAAVSIQQMEASSQATQFLNNQKKIDQMLDKY